MDTQLLTRRRVIRLAGAAMAAALPIATFANGAEAGRGWCRHDPVVKIDGQVVDIWVSSYQEMYDLATGAVIVVVKVPKGATAELLAVDQGFGYGYDIRFETSDNLTRNSAHTQVRVSVYAPASTKELPVRVEFSPRSTGPLSEYESEYGTANSWVVIKTD